MPSTDDAAAVLVLVEIAMNALFPYVTACQSEDEGSVLAVQSMPFADVAAAVVGPLATATKSPLPKATPYHA